MKKLLCVIIFLITGFQLNSQCNLIGTYSPNPLPCSQTALLSVTSNASSIVFGEDFNSGSPVGWQWTQTVTIANNTCNVPSLDGSNFMWMGSASQHPRTMTTTAVDLSCGGDICFEMRYAIQGHSAPCEGPDLTNEGVYLQYSLNNNTWVNIDYWPPLNGGSSSSPMTQWAQYCRAIPAAAQTTSTYIRWHQASSSSSIYDHWGLDNIGVSATTCGNYQITWLHDNYSLPTGTYNGTNPNGVSPTTNTSYVVQMTNGITTCYDTINVVVAQPVLTTNDVTICEGETTTLNVSSSINGGNYSWSNGSSSNSINVSPTSTTTYNVDYLLSPCPTVTNNVTVTVNPAPTVSINSATICEGESITLTATPSQNGGAFLWSNGSTSSSITVSPLSSSSYSVIYNLGGCVPAFDTALVTVNAAPTVTLLNDSICEGETSVLTANPSQSGGTYSWSTGASSQAISVNPVVTSTYTVTYALAGCTPASASASVTVNPAPTISVLDDSICEGETIILSAIPSQSGGSFSWSNGSTTQDISVNPITTTNYSVTYTLGGCTPANATAVLTVNPAPIISVSNDSICEGESALLVCTANQTGGVFSWSNNWDQDSLFVNPIVTSYYSVTYTLGNCTVPIDSGLVTVTPAPTVQINNDSICVGESSILTAIPSQTGGTFLWSTNSTSNNINVTPSTTSTYYVDYNLGGCNTAIDSAFVTVNPLPVVTINDIVICEGATGTLSAIVDQSGGTFLWSTGASTQSINSNPLIPTNYTVTYTLGGCTPVDASGLIDIHLAPSVSVSDATICNGETAQLNAILSLNDPSQSGGNFLWSTAATTQDINVSPPISGVYIVSYNVGGCLPAIDSATITVNPLPDASFSASILEGCSPLTTQLNANYISPSASYLWELSDGQTLNGNPISPTFSNPGNYDIFLRVISDLGCVDSLLVPNYIYVEEDPQALFTPTPSVFKDLSEQVTFFNQTIGANAFVWNFGDGGQSTLSDPSHWYDNTIGGHTIYLIAFSPLNCTDTTSFEIPYEEGLVYFIPNSFTPDGDGFNQTFQPVFTSGFDPNEFSMKIFNRWGEIVFESKNANIGWDGSYGINGEKVQEGVYSYFIMYKIPAIDERRIVTGHVSLIR